MTYETTQFFEQDETWKLRAACFGHSTRLFFPERGESVQEAKQICQGCDVRLDCLEYAMAIPNCSGIWGGMSGRERRELRRNQRNSQPIQHGSVAGYRAEIRQGLEPCDECYAAHRHYERERSRKYR
jgi:WhiB family redox-sensing transcriptional regulator